MVADDRGSVGRVVWHFLHPTEQLGPYFRALCGMEPTKGLVLDPLCAGHWEVRLLSLPSG